MLFYTLFILSILSCEQKNITIESIDYSDKSIKLKLSGTSNINYVDIYEADKRVFRQSFQFETNKFTLNYKWNEHKEYTFHISLGHTKIKQSKRSPKKETTP